MAIKIFFNTVMIIALVAAQLAFVSNLPYPISSLRLVLIALLYILLLIGLKPSLWWTIGCGALLDVYSMGIFGANLLELAAIVMAMHVLLARYFTDRSVYTFIALTAVAVLSQDLIRGVAGVLANLIYGAPFRAGEAGLFAFEAYALAVNLAVVAILFYFVNYISTRFKPVFLVRRKNK